MKHREFVKTVRRACEGYQVFARRNGTVEIRKLHSYFSSFIENPEEWAIVIQKRLAETGLSVTIIGGYRPAQWPKESYWTAIVTQVEEAR